MWEKNNKKYFTCCHLDSNKIILSANYVHQRIKKSLIIGECEVCARSLRNKTKWKKNCFCCEQWSNKNLLFWAFFCVRHQAVVRIERKKMTNDFGLTKVLIMILLKKPVNVRRIACCCQSWFCLSQCISNTKNFNGKKVFSSLSTLDIKVKRILIRKREHDFFLSSQKSFT